MRWTRAIVGGILAELLLMVLFVPVAAAVGFDRLSDPDNLPAAVVYAVVGGSFIAPLLLVQWVARRLSSRFVVHGAIVGFVAFAVYIIPVLAAGGEQPPIYWLAHAMKVLGGTVGGVVAARRHAARPAAAAV